MRQLVIDGSRALGLLAAAALLGSLANGLARADRRLAWTGRAPAATAPAAPALVVPAAGNPLPAPPPAAAPPPRSARTGPTGPAAAAAPASRPPVDSQGKPAARPETGAPAAAGPIPETAAARFAPSPSAVIREISSADALAAFQLKVPFLDARRSQDFEAGHLPGAWSLPVWEAGLEARITGFEARANPQPRAPIAIYCSGGDCEDSRLLAQKLVELGYRNLLIYRDGYPDWIAQGRPVSRGPRP
jgi:rhodanese-related sulfurtransferase